MNYVMAEAEDIIIKAMHIKGGIYSEDYIKVLEYTLQILKDTYKAGKTASRK